MRLVKASANSITRLANQKAEVAKSMSTAPLRRGLGDLTNPPSLSGSMRKAGVALIVTPDPFTGVPGVVLLAASFAAKRNEPANLSALAIEARKVLRDVQSLGL